MISLLSILIPYASAANGDSVDLVNPLLCNSIPDCACLIADAVFTIALPISIIMFLIGAVLLLSSAGSEKRISQAKTIFLYAVVGLVIVLVAGSLPRLIVAVLGGANVPAACT